MVNYHRLALITESLKLGFSQEDQNNKLTNNDEEAKIVSEDKQGKNLLYSNLLKLNEEEEVVDKNKRKFSDDEEKNDNYTDNRLSNKKFLFI